MQEPPSDFSHLTGWPALAAELRAATRAAHHRIDHHPLLAPLVRPGLTLSHYMVVLRALAWIYGTLDPVFDNALRRLSPDAGFRISNRTGWLTEDLHYLEIADMPQPQPWQAPRIDSAAGLVGRLYAIEGSTLGGQVIARQLELSLGLGPTAGGRLFHGHGVATDSHWQGFLEYAGRACPPSSFGEACAAANDMFAEMTGLLDLCFARWCPS